MRSGQYELSLKGTAKAEIPNKKGKSKQDFSYVMVFSAPVERFLVECGNTQVMSPILKSQLQTVNTYIVVCTAINFLCNGILTFHIL